MSSEELNKKLCEIASNHNFRVVNFGSESDYTGLTVRIECWTSKTVKGYIQRSKAEYEFEKVIDCRDLLNRFDEILPNLDKNGQA